MAATADKDKAARAKAKERAAKAKEKERVAKAKAKEKAAKAREKEKAAKAREKEKAAKAREKEKAAKAREKEKAAKAREKEKAAKARAKEKARTATAKAPVKAPPSDDVVQPVEEVAVPERGETTEVPAEQVGPARTELPELMVPDNDRTVRPKGYLAEALGKEEEVDRSTQRATLAASYTTRDHDVIRAWAQTRNGRPADVAGTGGRRRGPGTAGVLRIEFPDGPGDDGRLEDIDWAPFFETFDASDVDFLYQERVRTGDVSRFHKFVRASA